ncbi:hypothetical protein DRN74_01645 [Candidatus Micrarchaeota archaeon]|nr:MAG: hypothetical protein DRN74_01645 [Candidatus Micrarchaeota archaeon]
MKAQTAMEYLVLTAVVLTIVTVVSYMILTASKASGQTASEMTCRATASSYKLAIMADPNACDAECEKACEKACVDSNGYDVIGGEKGCGTGCQACKSGTLH